MSLTENDLQQIAGLLKEATDSLRTEFKSDLKETTDSLRAEFKSDLKETSDSLRVEFKSDLKEISDSLRQEFNFSLKENSNFFEIKLQSSIDDLKEYIEEKLEPIKTNQCFLLEKVKDIDERLDRIEDKLDLKLVSDSNQRYNNSTEKRKVNLIKTY